MDAVLISDKSIMRWIQIQEIVTDQSIEMDAVFYLTNLMRWIQIQEAVTDQSIEMDAVFI